MFVNYVHLFANVFFFVILVLLLSFSSIPGPQSHPSAVRYVGVASPGRQRTRAEDLGGGRGDGRRYSLLEREIPHSYKPRSSYGCLVVARHPL